jgi:hypothetical protein
VGHGGATADLSAADDLVPVQSQVVAENCDIEEAAPVAGDGLLSMAA